MKKHFKTMIAALLVIAALFISIPRVYADNSPFVDVNPDFWAYNAIVEAFEDGVMMGTGTTESGGRIFTPSGKLNMAQFVTVLTRAFYNGDVQNMSFMGAWPEPNYGTAYLHDLFTDVKSYTRDMNVTREVMAQMMYNVMVDKGAILPNATEIQAAMNKIPDLSSVDSSYRTAVAVCYYLDLLSGVDAQGTFAPKGVLNRAQTAVIYTRLKMAISVLGTGTPGTTNPGITNPGIPDPGATQTPTGATLTNGMPVTEENVLALIEEYRNGKAPGEKAKEAGFTSYVDGSRYNANEPQYRIVLPGGPMNGSECAKFAFAFFDDIFGSDAPVREVTDPADVHPGDLLWSGTHWSVAVQAAYTNKYQEICSQTVGGGPTGLISWGTIEEPVDNLMAIYSKYPK